MNEMLVMEQQSALFEELKIDCKNCCGLCCSALYCFKTEGFPADKAAGVPCRNLMPDFRCKVHTTLEKHKLKGCIAYDCLGSGQKVTRNIYKGLNWKEVSEAAKQIYEVFLIVHELHQMLWYLAETSMIRCAGNLRDEINVLIGENKKMTNLEPEEIIAINISIYKENVNQVLKDTSELVQLEVNGKISKKHETDFFGKNLKNVNLKGKDFSMSLIIAADLEGCNLYGANFLGADIRDTNIIGADLSQSIYLTQMQVNSAKGNRTTKLPARLSYPNNWGRL